MLEKRKSNEIFIQKWKFQKHLQSNISNRVSELAFLSYKLAISNTEYGSFRRYYLFINLPLDSTSTCISAIHSRPSEI